MDNPETKPLLFRGGAARLASLLASRSGVVLAALLADARHHPNPSSEEEGL